jgi:FkbM family methyltransferase
MNMTSFENQLEEVLGKDVLALVNNHTEAFRRMTAKIGERYVLFGAGRLGQITLGGLRQAGITPLAFVENNPNLWDTFVDGLQVFSPQEAAARFSQDSIFVITVYTSQPVWEQLTSMGLKVVSFAELAWMYPQTLTPHGGVELPYKIFEEADDVGNALSLWADDTSRREYLGQIEWQTSLNRSVLPPHLPQNEIYFADKIIAFNRNETFVDCGAFDGDTIQEFLKRSKSSFERIIAIEPDPANCIALEARVSALPVETQKKIQVIQSAVGSKRALVTFNATGTAGSSFGNGSYVVKCAPLDELLDDAKPTFIKMDIEGAEPDALLGARSIIERDCPVLAICLYHAQEHLWQVPLLIQSLNSKYDFFLRRYADECWELVCYAVPKNRPVA